MKNRFNAKRFNLWTALAWLFVATSLVFAGCSKQIAGIKENQVKMQNIVQAQYQQIAADAARIEDVAEAVNSVKQKQTVVQEQITTLQSDNQLLREQMITMLTQFKEQLTQISTRISSSEMARK